jgi:hypothetical protein
MFKKVSEFYQNWWQQLLLNIVAPEGEPRAGGENDDASL